MPYKRRSYDSGRRKEQAQRGRERTLGVAKRQFFARGYAATTVGSVAKSASVSVETIYKTFGGKPGLVRALYEQGLAGAGAVHAEARSDAVSTREPSAHEIVRHWGVLAAEVSPRVSPLLLLVRAAAASDPVLADLLETSDADRLVRMRHNARKLAKGSRLRRGVTVEKAAALMWALTAPELFDLLVVRRGWSPAELGELLGTTMAAALLPPRAVGRRTRERSIG